VIPAKARHGPRPRIDRNSHHNERGGHIRRAVRRHSPEAGHVPHSRTSRVDMVEYDPGPFRAPQFGDSVRRQAAIGPLSDAGPSFKYTEVYTTEPRRHKEPARRPLAGKWSGGATLHFSHEFVVRADEERVWQSVTDVPFVFSCIPGAQLDGQVAPDAYGATIVVDFGELSFNFRGSVRCSFGHDRTGVIHGEGRDKTGLVAAGGDIRLEVAASGQSRGTRVYIEADIQFSGVLAPVATASAHIVAGRLIRDFATALADRLEALPA